MFACGGGVGGDEVLSKDNHETSTRASIYVEPDFLSFVRGGQAKREVRRGLPHLNLGEGAGGIPNIELVPRSFFYNRARRLWKNKGGTAVPSYVHVWPYLEPLTARSC